MSLVLFSLWLQEATQVSTATSNTSSKGNLHTGDQLQDTDKQLALPATEFPHEFRCVCCVLLGRAEMSRAFMLSLSLSVILACCYGNGGCATVTLTSMSHATHAACVPCCSRVCHVS